MPDVFLVCLDVFLVCLDVFLVCLPMHTESNKRQCHVIGSKHSYQHPVAGSPKRLIARKALHDMPAALVKTMPVREQLGTMAFHPVCTPSKQVPVMVHLFCGTLWYRVCFWSKVRVACAR